MTVSVVVRDCGIKRSGPNRVTPRTATRLSPADRRRGAQPPRSDPANIALIMFQRSYYAPEEKHLAEVSSSLAGVAASVRVVRLPEKDPFDWISAEGTADAIWKLGWNEAYCAGADTYKACKPNGAGPAPCNAMYRRH